MPFFFIKSPRPLLSILPVRDKATREAINSLALFIDKLLTDLGTQPEDNIVTPTWTALAYNTGWQAIAGKPALESAILPDQTISLRGTAIRTSGAETTIATLPVGSRPLATLKALAILDNDASTALTIATTGILSVVAGSEGTGVWFTGVWFDPSS